MARIGVFIPCGSADGANVARATIQDQCAFDDVRIIRLRDRAHVEGVSALEGPRLAVEPSTHVPDGETRDPLSEEQMAAELRGEGWYTTKPYWTDGDRLRADTAAEAYAILASQREASKMRDELRAEGWKYVNAAGGWVPPGNPVPVYTVMGQAHAAMRAAKGAK